MGDWRRIEKASQERLNNISGNNINTSGGIFQGLVESSSGENQNAQLIYAGGSSSIPLPMPFESTDSWIRSIPISGSAALVTYRRDTGEATFVRYLNDSPDKKIAGYSAGGNLYKPLLPGEHEIHSSGLAQTYYSQRPVLDQRAGVIRSWLDQDRAECGQKAPIHTRLLHKHRSNEIGDEERLGVVRRPKQLNIINALLQGGMYSSNFYMYPYPNFSLPGGIPSVYSSISKVAGTLSEAAATLTGTFKIRPFAKEYLRVIKNPIPILPQTPILIDIREGQVFDDDGVQVTGSSGSYLRAKHEYFTPLGDSTKCEIDELGNVSWGLSYAATDGWVTNVPFGSWKLSATKGIDISTSLSSITMSSLLSTSISATTDISLDSTLNTDFTTGLNFSHSTTGTYDSSASLDMSLSSSMNFNAEAGLIFEAKGGVQMNLNAPIVQIGSSPNDTMVMGKQLLLWLNTLLDAFIKGGPIGMGNLGAPVPLNPAILAVLQNLQTTVCGGVASEPISLITSKTITVSP